MSFRSGDVKLWATKAVSLGGEGHEGWLPPAAARPDKTASREVGFCFSISHSGPGFIFAYRSIDDLIRNDSWHDSLEEAKREARDRFGLQEGDWTVLRPFAAPEDRISANPRDLLDDLGPFARSFAAALFEAFPDLRAMARAVDGELLVEFSPEPKREDARFFIDSDIDEITVGFAGFHFHFDWPATRTWADPLVFIRDLMTEETLVECRLRGGDWLGASTLGRDEEPVTTDLEPGDVLQIRSWTGALDRTIMGE